MIFNAPNTKKNRIAAMIAIALGLGVGFYFSVSADKDEKTIKAPAESRQVSDSVMVSPSVSTPPKPQSIEDVDFTAYSSDLANYLGFERGESRISAIDKVRLQFASRQSEIVHTSTTSFDVDGGSVLIFSVSGMKDDSVKAQEVFLIMQGDEGKQTLAEYGMRIKCHLGENTTAWQKDLCP